MGANGDRFGAVTRLTCGFFCALKNLTQPGFRHSRAGEDMRAVAAQPRIYRLRANC